MLFIQKIKFCREAWKCVLNWNHVEQFLSDVGTEEMAVLKTCLSLQKLIQCLKNKKDILIFVANLERHENANNTTTKAY